MKIMQQFAARAKDPALGPVTLAFLGDSVTQGCFEVYRKPDGTVETVYHQEYAYHACLRRMLGRLYPSVPVNVINAGRSGDSAPGGLARLERDVLRRNPDLAVVCFGLNDAMQGMEHLPRYRRALEEIFAALARADVETICLTPNMMAPETRVRIEDPEIGRIAGEAVRVQNDGTFDAYMEAARAASAAHGVAVCDCYARWKRLQRWGADIPGLLANQINHPLREMHWLFASALLETMLREDGRAASGENHRKGENHEAH